MNINPQFTYDKQGKPLGVFLTMEEWLEVSKEVVVEVPEWQKNEIRKRLGEYYANPEIGLDFDDVIRELNE